MDSYGYENDRAKAHLRVKIKSLAAEARIIRQEERRAKASHERDLLTTLSEHRRVNLRMAARETNLAYAFVRCIPYRVVERPGSRPVNWASVRRMVCRFLGVDGLDAAVKFDGEIGRWKDAVPVDDGQGDLFESVSA